MVPAPEGLVDCHLRRSQLRVLERLKHQMLEKEKAIDLIAGPDAYRDLPRMLQDSADGNAQARAAPA